MCHVTQGGEGKYNTVCQSSLSMAVSHTKKFANVNEVSVIENFVTPKSLEVLSKHSFYCYDQSVCLSYSFWVEKGWKKFEKCRLKAVKNEECAEYFKNKLLNLHFQNKKCLTNYKSLTCNVWAQELLKKV